VARTPVQVALNWLPDDQVSTALVVGARTAEQLADGLGGDGVASRRRRSRAARCGERTRTLVPAHVQVIAGRRTLV